MGPVNAASRKVSVLGSTGSIGVSTLDVIARHPERFSVHALTGNRSVDRLFEQCMAHRPAYAVMVCEQSARELARRLSDAGANTEVLQGVEGLNEVAADAAVDVVMAAIVGVTKYVPSEGHIVRAFDNIGVAILAVPEFRMVNPDVFR